jgi:hypothetical protein
MSAVLKEVKAATFIPWARLNALLNDLGNGMRREDLRALIVLIRNKHTADLARARILIALRARHCESLTARLQLLEQRGENAVSEEGRDDVSPDESELVETIGSESTELKYFDFPANHPVVTLQPSPVVTVNCFSLYRDTACQAKLQTSDHGVARLRSCNEQYLSLGLAWKKKCLETRKKLKDLVTERANEIRELARIIEEAPWRVK